MTHTENGPLKTEQTPGAMETVKGAANMTVILSHRNEHTKTIGMVAISQILIRTADFINATIAGEAMERATVSVYVEDYCKVLRESQPTARKQHKCGECRRAIEVGEKYNLEATLYDGEISTYKTCLDCMSIRREFFKGGFYYEGIIDALDEHVNDCGGDISESCLASLTPGARTMVCEMIEETWNDENYEE